MYCFVQYMKSRVFHFEVKMHLQVVGDEQLSQVIHLQHGGGIVLTDAVALQQVLGGHHLPGQPAQVESSVA